MTRCAFCPHSGTVHQDRDGMCWCISCEEPCSFYFIRVHDFDAVSKDRPGPHGSIDVTDCRVCGLSAGDNAHQEVFA